jgi:S-adenosylmethionine hydrolase
VIPVLDVQYGNVWSNIDRDLFEQLGAKPGDRFEVRLLEKGRLRAKFVAPYATTFGEVPEGKPLLFLNSLHQVAVALNQASLAQRYRIGSGPDWTMQVRPLRKASSPR